MSSNLFNCLGENQPQTQQQDPRSAVMERMKQMGISVPEGMENDPNALLQHVLQSGAVPQSRLSMAQQILQKMFRR